VGGVGTIDLVCSALFGKRVDDALQRHEALVDVGGLHLATEEAAEEGAQQTQSEADDMTSVGGEVGESSKQH
jgi:hypothetical protein